MNITVTLNLSPEATKTVVELTQNLAEVVALLADHKPAAAKTTPKKVAKKAEAETKPEAAEVKAEESQAEAVETQDQKAAPDVETKKQVELFQVIKLINEYSKKASVDGAKRLVASYGVKATKELNDKQLNDIFEELTQLLKGL